jgi:hypothetical protein
MAQLSEQLIDDHAALDTVLKALQTALQRRDRETAHANLDLFWARLAVHIRAEHLHLFPAVLGIEGIEAKTVVAQLRGDHEFFMRNLGQAVESMRKLLTVSEQRLINEELNDIQNTVSQVEQRLITHNQIEENQVYRWAATLLNSAEQAKLKQRITAELRNRPSRFNESDWSDEHLVE